MSTATPIRKIIREELARTSNTNHVRTTTMSDIVYVSNARLSFPNLATPQKRVGEGGKERISYNCELILAPNDPGFAAFMQQVGAIATAKWKEHTNQVFAIINADRKLRCYGNGNEKVNQKTFKVYDGYADHVYITAGRDTPPQVMQADGKPIDPENTMLYQQLTRKLYGGCYVNAAVKPWMQENVHGRGVRCDLIAVQFLRDGEAFGEGAADASAMFGAVAAAPGAAPAVPGAAPAAAAMPPWMAR